MNRALIVESAGPAVSLQDLGRPGFLAAGLSPGGAMDPQALAEAVALLAARPGDAALEMGALGGRFRLAGGAARIALTGAPMRAKSDGVPLRWNAVHMIEDGSVIEIGACQEGRYGYLSIGGGIATEQVMGSRAFHSRAGLGQAIAPGMQLPLGKDTAPTRYGRMLPADPRFQGGVLRVLPNAQTALFSPAQRAAFAATRFTISARGNRLGAALALSDSRHMAQFTLAEGLSLLSETTLAGDIQITGDGTPFILMADCQTMGGYPRIASILPQDIPRAAQAAPGSVVEFRWIDPSEALSLHHAWRQSLARLPAQCLPMIRDPADMPDLLTAQLISGVTDGAEREPQAERPEK
ncbi:MAG: urea amidolyase [Mangrovicoccus sp.]|nr:urea amidolyase [Mangrovicoccus sp.]